MKTEDFSFLYLNRIKVILLTRSWSFTAALVLMFLSTMSLIAQVRVSLPNVTSTPGRIFTIPVSVGTIEEEKITAFEFVVSCDTSVMKLLGVEQKGTRTEGLMMLSNNSVVPFNKGRMKVVCASAYPISGDGILVNLLASVESKEGKSPIELSDVTLNAGNPASILTNGSITVRLTSDVESKRKPAAKHQRVKKNILPNGAKEF